MRKDDIEIRLHLKLAAQNVAIHHPSNSRLWIGSCHVLLKMDDNDSSLV